MFEGEIEQNPLLEQGEREPEDETAARGRPAMGRADLDGAMTGFRRPGGGDFGRG